MKKTWDFLLEDKEIKEYGANSLQVTKLLNNEQ